MADEKNIKHATDIIKRKRSRYWDLEETKKLIYKRGEDNILEFLKSCTRFCLNFFIITKKKFFFC